MTTCEVSLRDSIVELRLGRQASTIRKAFRFFMVQAKNTQRGRKQPKQARSRVTVETILDGAVRVLEQEGTESATTTRIAEVAGVSVGTLYQYFSERDDILDALQDREFEKAKSMLFSRLSGGAASERELARSIVSALLELYRSAPALHRLLAIDGLRIAPTDRIQAYDHQMVELLRAFFEATKLRVKRANRHAAAFVLYHSVRATMLAAILEDNIGLSDEVLKDELTDLVVSHLVGSD
jgi:AcrR family transcriptional regulator